MMMDDDLDAKVNLRQPLNEAALMEHQQKKQLARDQFLRRQIADEAALEKAAYAVAASQRLVLAEESANAARAADAEASSLRLALAEEQFNAARAADAMVASQRQAVAEEKANMLKLEMFELQQRAEAFALEEKRAREVHLAVLRECELQAERDRQQLDVLRLQNQAHAQERHECLLSQQRLVIEHQAAQAYGEAAAAEIRVAEFVAEDSLQQGATLFWKSRDEHLSERREMEANAEIACRT